MDKHLEVLNHLMAETFNEVLKVEEQSIKQTSGDMITVTEVHTLDAIGLGDPRTVSELAAAMMVTVSTMTISINRLEKKGFVERERANDDRRVVRVHLTEHGRSIVNMHRQYHNRMAQTITEYLSSDEMDTLCHTMEKLKKFFRFEHEAKLKNEA